ncbi:MAG: hypothetical protein J6J64_06200 [Alistipes sp.]|nr:hypothetical protein [Alistipes sp.]
MKNVKFLFVALILAVGFASCEKEPSPEPVKPIIEFEATEVGIDAYGTPSSLIYSIKNIEEGVADKLTATYDASWLSVEIGDDAVTLSAERNEAESHRTADVVFSYKGADDVTVRVLQAGGAEEDIAKVEIEVTSVDSTMITFNVTASHPDLTWIPMVTYSKYWTEPVNDEEIYIYDLEYFKYLAENYGVSLEEFLSEMLGKGSQEGIVIERLDPETEYVIYVYGLALDGTRLTDVVWTTATTAEAYEGDVTFEFDIKEENYVMEFVVTPSHLGVDFYYGVASEAEIAQWKAETGGDDLVAAIQYGDIEYTMQLLMDYNFIDERIDYYDMFNCYNVVDDGWAEVNAGTKYILYAAKWNENCELQGPVSTAEYTTPRANLSDNVITLDITEITQSSVSVEMTTTNNDPYVVLPVRSDVIEGMTDEEIYAFVVDEYSVLVNEYTFYGNWSKTFGRMRPGTEYTILAFGNLAGVQTTDMIKREISTIESGDPKDCTFETLCVPGADNVWLEIIPSDKGHHYFYEIYPADYTEEDAKSFIRYVISEDYEGSVAAFSSWRLYQGDLTTTEEGLTPTTDYKLGIIIMDYDTGEFLSDMYFSEVFTTTEMTYADVSITVNWDKYYDANELCDAGYTQFNSSKGNCIVPISLDIVGDYSEYYFAFFNRDLTDEVLYPDDIFYQELQNNGFSQKNIIIDLPYDQEMTATAVVYDLGYKPGKIFRKVVTFTKEGASPASEFGGSKQSLLIPQSLVVVEEPEVETVGSERDVQLLYNDDEAMKHEARAFVRELRLEKALGEVERRTEDMDSFRRRMVR